jgi:hypothetical protein
MFGKTMTLVLDHFSLTLCILHGISDRVPLEKIRRGRRHELFHTMARCIAPRSMWYAKKGYLTIEIPNSPER